MELICPKTVGSLFVLDRLVEDRLAIGGDKRNLNFFVVHYGGTKINK